MRNCLITKLKESVDNDNLKRLGCLRIGVNYTAGNSGAAALTFKTSSSNSEVVAYNGGYFATTADGLADVATRLTRLVLTPNTFVSLFFPNLDFYFEVSDKYGINYISNTSTSLTYRVDDRFSICLDEFEYNEPINSLTVSRYCVNGDMNKVVNKVTDTISVSGTDTRRNHITWDFEKLSVSNVPTALYVQNTDLTGELSQLGKLVGLTTINILRSNISGTIEGFVNAQMFNGRSTVSSSSSINLSNVFANVSFYVLNKNAIPSLSNYTCFLTWESASKIIMYLSTDTTFSHYTIVCEYGASQEEITGWLNSGKTVYDAATGQVVTA